MSIPETAADRLASGPPQKIYLAGKVTKPDWREAIVGAPYSDVSTDESKVLAGKEYPVLAAACLGYDYTGPYAFSCDHGCYHGDAQHGVGASHGGCVNGTCETHGDQWANRLLVLERSLAAIREATIVFAWLERDALAHDPFGEPRCSAYGTLAEIGYAHALGKTLWIGTPEHIPELWFVMAMSDSRIVARDPFTALENLITPDLKTMEYRAYLATPHWQRIRQGALARAAYKCILCDGTSNLNVHHKNYERRGQERPDDLIVLCKRCHQTHHGK